MYIYIYIHLHIDIFIRIFSQHDGLGSRFGIPCLHPGTMFVPVLPASKLVHVIAREPVAWMLFPPE